MTPTWISECLSRIRGARVGVFGDYHLDGRWELDAGEVGAAVRPVTAQRYALGGCGNIAANLAALGCNAVYCVGLIADDIFGRYTLDLMRNCGVKFDGMLRAPGDWQTPMRARTLLGEREIERIDFGRFNRAHEATVTRLAEAIGRTAAWCDVLVVRLSAAGGLSNELMVEHLNDVIRRFPRCRFLVDDPVHAPHYEGAMLYLDSADGDPAAARGAASEAFGQSRQPVFASRGIKGLLLADASGLHENPMGEVHAPVNAENLHETTLAGLGAAMCGGVNGVTAARFADLAARQTCLNLRGPATVTPDTLRRMAST